MYQQLMLFNPDEEWRDIPGWQGVYQISSTGKARRLGKGSGVIPGRIITGNILGTGYVQMNLYSHQIRERYSAHELVMLAFVGPRPEGCQINHKNGNKADNRLSNLEYVTPSENKRHAYDVLHRKAAHGTRKPNARFADEDIKTIRQLWKTKRYRLSDIGEMYGVRKSHISIIVNNKIWKHIGE